MKIHRLLPLLLMAAWGWAMGSGCESDSLGFHQWGDGIGTPAGDGSTASGDGKATTGDGSSTKKDKGPAPNKDSFVPKDVMPVTPPKKEICGDGIDNNKDGKVDENCGCKIGSTQKCFPWPQLLTKGECKQGTQNCTGAGEFGKWSACVGAVTPKPEICGNGKDEDCNGADIKCPPKCPDGVCNGNENCQTCPQDCGKCCGNNKCEPAFGENCKTCVPDCGQCPPTCGDGVCNGKETCLTCPKDCGQCPTKCDTFTYGVTARAVDIVFIIDQSGSMSQEISSVKAYLNQFSSYIAGVKIDYRVIMLAKRGTSTYYICIPPPLGGANCADNTRYKQVDQLINSWDSLKQYQAHAATIEGFMRKNSLRQIVEITDDRSYYVTAAAFNSWIKARPGYSDYIFHSIVGLNPGGCVASVGQQYIDLSNMTKGMKFHICNANWNSLFQQLGKSVAGSATAQYPLTKTPLLNKVDVTYNGVKKTQGVHYAYIPGSNWVQLKAPYPANNTTIKICYQYAP